MGKGFRDFVEYSMECKYVPADSRCALCGKKMGIFHTGFWSINVHRYNLQLSDGVLCRKCREKAERYIKDKRKWMNEELRSHGEWAKFKSTDMLFYSAEDIKMLAEQKEISDKKILAEYGKDATGLFEIKDSFGLGVSAYDVGIVRAKKFNDKTVVFGTVEEGVFLKGDRVKVVAEEYVTEALVLEAYGLDKDSVGGRDMNSVFFETLGADLKFSRKVKENCEGWLILDIDWKYKINGGRIIKID